MNKIGSKSGKFNTAIPPPISVERDINSPKKSPNSEIFFSNLGFYVFGANKAYRIFPN